MATDQANARAGKAAAVAAGLEAQSERGSTYYYDAAKGVVVADKTEATKIAPYGKTSDAKGSDNIEGVTGNMAQDLTKDFVEIVIDTDNTVTVHWVAPASIE